MHSQIQSRTILCVSTVWSVTDGISPPPYFQFEIENAVIMCKLKGFYLHEIWGNKHNLGDAFLLMEKL